MPVRLNRGQDVMSGSNNAGDAFDLRVTRRAADSTYAGIVRLVEAAQASKAPMARLADRYSLLFLVATVGLATAAWWFTGDPIRAVAVLVVATPCPLILAVPVALVAGLSRAAHFGVLIKGAKPLEALARIQTLILDKTGTLTDGSPTDCVHRRPWRSVRRRSSVFCCRSGSGIETPDCTGDRRGGTCAGHPSSNSRKRGRDARRRRCGDHGGPGGGSREHRLRRIACWRG